MSKPKASSFTSKKIKTCKGKNLTKHESLYSNSSKSQILTNQSDKSSKFWIAYENAIVSNIKFFAPYFKEEETIMFNRMPDFLFSSEKDLMFYFEEILFGRAHLLYGKVDLEGKICTNKEHSD